MINLPRFVSLNAIISLGCLLLLIHTGTYNIEIQYDVKFQPEHSYPQTPTITEDKKQIGEALSTELQTYAIKRNLNVNTLDYSTDILFMDGFQTRYQFFIDCSLFNCNASFQYLKSTLQSKTQATRNIKSNLSIPELRYLILTTYNEIFPCADLEITAFLRGNFDDQILKRILYSVILSILVFFNLNWISPFLYRAVAPRLL